MTGPARMVPALLAAVEDWLSLDLDAWTRHVLGRHFDPESGSPYWLRQKLPFDPRDIHRYEELVAFEPFSLDELRTGDPRDLVPMAVERPLAGRIWESGGTTGTPGKVFYTDEMMRHRRIWRLWSIARGGIEPGHTWVQALPTGPHLIGNIARDLAEGYSSLVHTIDMDPRWVKRLIRRAKVREVNDYTTHLLDQIADCAPGGAVEYLATTPAVLNRLVQTRPELVAGLRGVFLSGTQITPEMYGQFRAELGGDTPIITNYGNTLGNCIGLRPEGDGAILPYLPQYPQVTVAVVDQENWRKPVDYGQAGRVRLTVLQEDLFLPNILERDQAIRYDPRGRWPADGAANVKPLRASRATPEGLY